MQSTEAKTHPLLADEKITMSRISSLTVLLIATSCTANDADLAQTTTTLQPAEETQGEAQPTSQPPTEQPELPSNIPPITTNTQPAQAAQGQATTDQTQGNGQWVYTDQYGWIWMPYSDSYIYTPNDTTGGYPYQYVYYPTYGWTWLSAPWVWGFGVQPFFAFGGFHHRFFNEHERGFHEGFHGERFRGGFHQPSGFPAPVARGFQPGFRGAQPGFRGAPGHAFGGHPMGPQPGHQAMGGPPMGGHPMGGPMGGGGHGGGGGGGGGHH
jgi:hypothetical protein